MKAPALLDQFGRPLDTKAGIQPFHQGTTRSRFRRPLTNQAVDSRVTQNKFTRSTLLAYARTLYANFGEVKGAIKAIARYSVGAGIKPQSMAGEVSSEYEAYFKEWAKVADYGGQFTFWGLQKLASLRMDIDGDIGFNMVTGANGWPMLQPIEGHRINGPHNDERIFDGVQISPSTGRPVAYYIKQKEDFKRIPARDFILVSDPSRVNQYRGLTALDHAITDVWDTSDILEFEKVGVKMRSAIGMAIVTEGGTTDDGMDLIQSGYTATDTGDLPWQTFDAGMIPRLKPNESINEVGGNQPSPSFTGFLEMLLRKTAVGLSLPFEFVWNPSAAGGAAQRAVLTQAQRTFTERAELLDTTFNNRVWGWVIAKGIKRGDIPHSEDWWRVTWQHPKKITVDVGREAKEAREDIKLGLKTFAEDAAERGLDWQEIVRQRYTENLELITLSKQLSSQTGISEDLALSLMSQRSANPPVESNDSHTVQPAT